MKRFSVFFLFLMGSIVSADHLPPPAVIPNPPVHLAQEVVEPLEDHYVPKDPLTRVIEKARWEVKKRFDPEVKASIVLEKAINRAVLRPAHRGPPATPPFNRAEEPYIDSYPVELVEELLVCLDADKKRFEDVQEKEDLRKSFASEDFQKIVSALRKAHPRVSEAEFHVILLDDNRFKVREYASLWLSKFGEKELLDGALLKSESLEVSTRLKALQNFPTESTNARELETCMNGAVTKHMRSYFPVLYGREEYSLRSCEPISFENRPKEQAEVAEPTNEATSFPDRITTERKFFEGLSRLERERKSDVPKMMAKKAALSLTNSVASCINENVDRFPRLNVSRKQNGLGGRSAQKCLAEAVGSFADIFARASYPRLKLKVCSNLR